MNRPAESIAGNASMTMFVFSRGPPVPLDPPPDVPEHPARTVMAATAAIDVRFAMRDFIPTRVSQAAFAAVGLSVEGLSRCAVGAVRCPLCCRRGDSVKTGRKRFDWWGSSGRYRMATLADVARHAGVAASTVSYVLSGKRPVSEETRERVAQSI